MAEATGLAFALPGLFTAVVQCFEWLELAQLRLLRWGTAVGLGHDPANSSGHYKSYLSFPEDDLDIMSDLLAQIKQGFARAECTATRYRSEGSNPTRLQDLGAIEPAQKMVLATRSSKAFHSFSQEMKTTYRSVASTGQKIAGRTSWALYHRSHFNTLINTTTGLVKELEELFPTIHARELELCRQKVSNVNPEDLSLLLEAVQNNDQMLREALTAEAEVHGIAFDNIRVEGDARTRLGNEYGNVRIVEKSGNKYTNLVIGGTTVSHVGNWLLHSCLPRMTQRWRYV